MARIRCYVRTRKNRWRITFPKGCTRLIEVCVERQLVANKPVICRHVGLIPVSICQVQEPTTPCEQFTARRKPACALGNIRTHVVWLVVAPIAQFWALSAAGLILREGQTTEDQVGHEFPTVG